MARQSEYWRKVSITGTAEYPVDGFQGGGGDLVML
jgi:hypothetical protein